MNDDIYKTAEYWDGALTKEEYGQLLSPITDANKDKKALDVCCGNGDLLLKLHEKGYLVSGIDFSEYGINTSKEKVEDAVLYKLDMNDIPSFETTVKEQFDLIILQNSLAFLNNKVALCKAIDNKLNPGGIFIISTPVLIRWCRFPPYFNS